MSSYAQNLIVAVGLPFGLAAVLVGVFVIWRPAWLRRAFERHGRALCRTVDGLAAVLLAGYAVRALRHHDGGTLLVTLFFAGLVLSGRFTRARSDRRS